MLRFASFVTTGAGLLLVVPTVTSQDAGVRIRTLEGALQQTLHALDTFNTLSDQVQEGQRDAVRAVRAFSEEPIADERARDERMFELRQEVNQLQIQLDALEGGLVPVSSTTLGVDLLPPPTPEATGMETEIAAEPSKLGGIDDRTLALLRDVRAPGEEPVATTGAPDASSTAPTVAPVVEKDGYSADPLRHAQACFRAERYEQGLEVLAPLEESPDVLLWRGLLFERLERLDEAAEALDRAARHDPESLVSARAAESLEFVLWKRSFLETLPGREPAPSPTQRNRP